MDGGWQSFCSSNVAIRQISLAGESGESGGKIAELARTVDVRKVSTSSRRAAFFVDVGRGLAREPKSRADAVGWLRRGRRSSADAALGSAGSDGSKVRALHAERSRQRHAQ
jgi:hypothetical protein